MLPLANRHFDALANPAKAQCATVNRRVPREAALPSPPAAHYNERRKESFMSTTITGVVTDGVVVPNSPQPEGAKVEVIVLTPEQSFGLAKNNARETARTAALDQFQA